MLAGLLGGGISRVGVSENFRTLVFGLSSNLDDEKWNLKTKNMVNHIVCPSFDFRRK